MARRITGVRFRRHLYLSYLREFSCLFIFFTFRANGIGAYRFISGFSFNRIFYFYFFLVKRPLRRRCTLYIRRMTAFARYRNLFFVSPFGGSIAAEPIGLDPFVFCYYISFDRGERHRLFIFFYTKRRTCLYLIPM